MLLCRLMSDLVCRLTSVYHAVVQAHECMRQIFESWGKLGEAGGSWMGGGGGVYQYSVDIVLHGKHSSPAPVLAGWQRSERYCTTQSGTLSGADLSDRWTSIKGRPL